MKVFLLFFMLVALFFTTLNSAFGDSAVDELTNLPSWVVIAGLVFIVIEYILGKTKWIKPNSILDTVFQVMLKIIKSILPYKK